MRDKDIETALRIIKVMIATILISVFLFAGFSYYFSSINGEQLDELILK